MPTPRSFPTKPFEMIVSNFTGGPGIGSMHSFIVCPRYKLNYWLKVSIKIKDQDWCLILYFNISHVYTYINVYINKFISLDSLLAVYCYLQFKK
jgi:hypothetical protein